MNSSNNIPELSIVEGDEIIASRQEPTKAEIDKVKPEIIVEELSRIFRDVGLFQKNI